MSTGAITERCGLHYPRVLFMMQIINIYVCCCHSHYSDICSFYRTLQEHTNSHTCTLYMKKYTSINGLAQLNKCRYIPSNSIYGCRLLAILHKFILSCHLINHRYLPTSNYNTIVWHCPYTNSSLSNYRRCISTIQLSIIYLRHYT